MGNIGDKSTTTGSDMIGLRCPIGDAKVMEVSDVQGVTAGTIKQLSDCLVVPFQTVTSGIYVAGYEIPKLNYAVIGGSAMVAGDKLSYNSTSDAFELCVSDVRFTGVILDTPENQSVASEAVFDFNGFGQISNSASDALSAV